MNLALFDFDGTLTSRDSLNEFLKYSVPSYLYIINMVLFSPIFILYKLKLIKNDIAKQYLFSLFFKGMQKEKFEQIAKEYSLNKLDDIVLSERIEILKKHQNQNDRIIIVSASMESWLKPWCEKHALELLCTKLEFVDDKFTGKFLTKNCYGQEKENRIKNHLDLTKFDEIYAYGDSAGDRQMLALADHAKLFKN